ncbi:MAG: TerB family tellurite resistance protein [Oxalobacteraceae bacterium]|nr:MAG: TerB family tellurite resistance protein [Oxalobacteraceae bacterium]
MRFYPSDSPQAVCRLLALTVISDGDGSPSEIAATYRLSILDYAGVEDDVFDQVVRELTTDLPTSADGLAKVEAATIDQCLAEITRPDLRLRLWNSMWKLAYADDRFADGEVALLHRATAAWGIESDTEGNGKIDGAKVNGRVDR